MHTQMQTHAEVQIQGLKTNTGYVEKAVLEESAGEDRHLFTGDKSILTDSFWFLMNLIYITVL